MNIKDIWIYVNGYKIYVNLHWMISKKKQNA